MQAATDGRFKAALARLKQCERRFVNETPFAFYAWLLGGDGGRARMLKRLGHEANDALDEFLELALNYERKAPASLQGFIAWLRAADTEVKRDMEISRDEVRVMTVHGAKGLEASVVFLVDTTTSPSDTQRLKLINLPQGNAGSHDPGVVVWAGRKAEDPVGVAAARTAMLGDTEDEYRRLLYVAMTRAADRLIVGGCMPGNMNSVRKLSWYDLITKGLASSGLRLQEIETPNGVVKRYSRAEEAAPADGAAAGPTTATPIVLPSWLQTPAPSETSAGSPLRPSDPADDDGHSVRTGESILSRAKALKRGTLVHRLLQSLPDIAAERRREAARAYLARNADGWTGDEQQALSEKAARADRGPALCPRLCTRQPRRGLDRGAARPARAPTGPGIRANRPPGGDGARGSDRRLQDQPDPAEDPGRGPAKAISASLRFTGRCLPGFIPGSRSARRYFGPKRLN